MTYHRATRRNGQGGFSLVEMMTGIGLAAIVSVVSVPNTAAFLSNYQLVSASNRLAFEINRARMQAVGQNAFVRIRFEGSGSYVRERSADGVAYVRDDVSITLPTGVTATVTPSGTPRFNRSGIAPTATAITLTNSRGSKTIQTNILGRVTVS